MEAYRWQIANSGLHRKILFQIAYQVAVVAGLGFVAIGVSGVVAFGFGMGFGKAFVSGHSPNSGITYVEERCADFLEFYPDSSSCDEAATYHHFDEILGYRFTAGVLGLLILGAAFAARRLFRSLLQERLLHPSFSPTVAASLFSLATVVFLGFSLVKSVFLEIEGMGALLSAGIVSLVMFAWCARNLYRTLPIALS